VERVAGADGEARLLIRLARREVERRAGAEAEVALPLDDRRR
jgi:hypothetical protein